tara:strand:+ start:1068 stop:1349 length:282 start_codon:yes stop_codon:yes gene_type:complete
MATKRDYKKEYKKFQSSTKAKKDRAARNKARRKALKVGRVRKGDGKDLHHPNGIKSSRTTVLSRSNNRGRKEKSRVKGSKRNYPSSRKKRSKK